MTTTGDRRWASARRGGMTVLGKVAVPKPINLPSQKLENHGLDPNVEIVPKGTLSWGSRSSSSASNAWGSSSPNTDGGTGSPSYPSGRPSSGGSGTRPSTASSDRASERPNNAWGPNSRPSSASGEVTLNQTSLTSLRPRSAETRPGSSQLSRFAEPLSENPVAWNAATTAEKLGVAQSKDDGFSLTSGDFPSLGSEKDNAAKNAESQDPGSHGCPCSSSGGVAPVKETSGTAISGDISISAHVNSAPVNPWRRDNPPHSEDGIRPNLEKWQGHAQPYPHGANIPSQHYDAWHGPPVNNPQGGIWYRGPPYGGHVPPGSFPMEPFPYYPSQIPPGNLNNSHPVPSPGNGPRGPHPKAGDIYRAPPMPDAYIRPGMPIRPGFYPGPPVPYEGYYGPPPIGYCNSNKRDAPFMGMAANSAPYNGYLSQNAPDPGKCQGRSSGHGSTGKTFVSEQVESGHPHDTRAPYRVLLKQHNGRDDKNEEQNWESAVETNQTLLEKGDQPRTSSWHNDWRSDHRKEDKTDLSRKILAEEASYRTSDDQSACSSFPAKAIDDASQAASGFSEVPRSVATGLKDSSLIQKIEGLNAKARTSDIRPDTAPVSTLEERSNKVPVNNAKASDSAVDAGAFNVQPDRTPAKEVINPASSETSVSAGDKRHELTRSTGPATSRRSNHGVQGRSDYRGRGKSNTQDVGLQKRPQLDNPVPLQAACQESSDVHVKVQHSSVATEKAESYPSESHDGEPVQSIFDSSDSQAQRAKVRELAKQRKKQLQEEEEERSRSQKARAQAKLEELNRRTQTARGTTQSFETDPSDAVQKEQEEYQTFDEPRVVSSVSGATCSAILSNEHIVAHSSERSTSTDGKSGVSSGEVLLKKPKIGQNELAVAHNRSVPLKQDAGIPDADRCGNASHIHDSSALKNKQMGYKQKRNIPSEKNFSKKSITNPTESPKIKTDAAASISASLGDSSQIKNPDSSVESSINPRKKNNKSGKNRHKVEEASKPAALPSTVAKETTTPTTESGKPEPSESETHPTSVHSMAISKDANHSLDQHLPAMVEESQGKGNGLWKSQHTRRMPRNPLNRAMDKFHNSDAVIWAPVRSINKTEVTEESNHKNGVEDVITSSIKDLVQNNPKNKRAEMERYVPKPVAKEMAQQGIIQPVVSSTSQTTSDNVSAFSSSQGTENTLPAVIAAKNVGLTEESRNGESKGHKQSKSHGSWRQRGSKESTNTLGVPDRPSKIQNPIIQQVNKVDGSSVKEQPDYYDEWNPPDGWNIPTNTDSFAPATTRVAKDQGVTGRVKRQQPKGYRGAGNNHDLDQKKFNRMNNEKSLTQSSLPEMSQRDLSSKESWGVGEHSISHWQPKSQAFPANNDQLGSRPNSGENVSANDHLPQDAKREKKSFSPRGGHPCPQNQGPGTHVEPVSMTVDVRHEAVRKTGNNRNNRFARGPESHGDWNFSGQENKQYNPASRERQRHTSHYEYQPVGPHNTSKWSNSEGPKDNPQRTGSTYRERGQSHSRRGGGAFHGRQSGTVHVESSFD